jgi:hypothetical protein
MANPQLTVKQFAIIALGQVQPPWHLANLLEVYNQKFISLRSTISNLSATQAVVYCAMRTAASVAACVLRAINGSAGGSQADLLELMNTQWDQLWTDITPASKNDLEVFEAILTPVGASIVYLSPGTQLGGGPFIPAWVTIGFTGSFAALASLPAQTLSFTPDNWTSNDWNILKNLSSGVVIVPPGTDYTSAALMVNGLYINPGEVQGPKTNMLVLA